MIMGSENINQLWTNLIVEECVRNGLNFFCMSPGSRSTPLTVAVAKNPKAQKTICYDERGAAYYAVGYARATQKPAVLICTSGTAVANYLPAVVEASKDNIPLLVLSADRPPELLETGANQTIYQPHIFGKYIRWEFNLGPPNIDTPVKSVLSCINLAIHRTKTNPAGPVHLNFMFREPLAPTKQNIPDRYIGLLKGWEKNTKPYTFYQQPTLQAEIGPIAINLSSAKDGLIVVGRLQNNQEIKAVTDFSEKTGWPLFADIASGLRTGFSLKTRIAYFDQILLSEEYKTNHKPDLILHIGGSITSKRYLSFIEQNPQILFVHINNSPERLDPAHIVNYKIQSDISPALFNINRLKLKSSQSLPLLKKWDSRINILLNNILPKNSGLSEPVIARMLSQLVPAGTGLFLSNSMPIRDMDMFANPDGPVIRIGTNRGASGIDGIIASAAGFASGLQRPVTCLIGDLALLHDLKSLHLVKNSPFPLTIIIVNNHGGGIFSFLPIADFPSLASYFETPHNINFEHAAKMFGLEYSQPLSLSGFKKAYLAASASPFSTIIEITTDINSNKKNHLEIYKAVKNLLKENHGG